jgi:hypothetical protein
MKRWKEEMWPRSRWCSTTTLFGTNQRPGFAGDYHGRDHALAILGGVFQETGV